jgi:hypothetical protein
MTKSNLEPPQPQMPVRPKRRAVLRPTLNQPRILWQSYTTELERDYVDLKAENESLKACINHLSGGSAQGLLAYRKFMLSRERKEEQQ